MSKVTLEQMVLVTFRTILGRVFEIELDEDLTIAQCKQIIQEHIAQETRNMNLVFKGSLLQDAAKIGSIRLGPGDVIIVSPPKESNAAQRPSERPTTEPLPEVSRAHSGSGLEGSPGCDRTVQCLMDRGFEREDCERALKAAFGNLDRAVVYLESGGIPDEQQHAQHESWRNILMQQPSALENVIRSFEEQDREMGQQFRKDPEQLLLFLGLNPSLFDLESVRKEAVQPAAECEAPPREEESIMDQFNEEEMATIDRLMDYGSGLPMVVQVYLACNKDEDATADCLLRSRDM